jgi:hypothetical protein
MILITEEIKEKNYSIFLKKLSELNIDTTLMESIFDKEKVKNATFNITNGGEGTLLHIILRILTPNALKIADLNAPDGFEINKESWDDVKEAQLRAMESAQSYAAFSTQRSREANLEYENTKFNRENVKGKDTKRAIVRSLLICMGLRGA